MAHDRSDASVYAHLDRNDAHLKKALEDRSARPERVQHAGEPAWSFMEEESQTMEQQNPPGRSCPACGSANYTFRSRKQIEATDGQEAMLETKYRCKGCGKDWKETVPGMLRKTPLQE